MRKGTIVHSFFGLGLRLNNRNLAAVLVGYGVTRMSDDSTKFPKSPFYATRSSFPTAAGRNRLRSETRDVWMEASRLYHTHSSVNNAIKTYKMKSKGKTTQEK